MKVNLWVNNVRVPLSLLRDVRLTVTNIATDRVETTTVISPFALSDDR